jgi:Pet100
MPVKSAPEIAKFGIYLLFPVATLFLFNRPEYLLFFKQPFIDKVREERDEEIKRLNVGLPTDLDSIQKRLTK